MNQSQKNDGLSPKLKAMLAVWSDEIEQQVLESPSAYSFLTKLDAYNEMYQLQDEILKAENIGVYFAAVEKLIIATVAKDVPKLAQIVRSSSRRIQAASRSEKAYEQQASEKAVELLKSLPGRLLKQIDNSKKLLQSKVVTDRGISPFKKLLRQLFENANQNVWDELSPSQLDQLEISLKEAKNRQAEKLLGLDKGTKITVPLVNEFLASKAKIDLEDEEKVQIATLVQMFRESGSRLFLGDQECTMGTNFESDRGCRRFVFRRRGEGGKSFKKQQSLPDGLKLI